MPGQRCPCPSPNRPQDLGASWPQGPTHCPGAPLQGQTLLAWHLPTHVPGRAQGKLLPGATDSLRTGGAHPIGPDPEQSRVTRPSRGFAAKDLGPPTEGGQHSPLPAPPCPHGPWADWTTRGTQVPVSRVFPGLQSVDTGHCQPARERENQSMFTDTMTTKPLKPQGNQTQVFTSKLGWCWGKPRMTHPGANMQPESLASRLQAREFCTAAHPPLFVQDVPQPDGQCAATPGLGEIRVGSSSGSS